MEKQQVRELLAPLEHMAMIRERTRIRTQIDALVKSLPAGALREVARRALAIVNGEEAEGATSS